MEFWIYFVKGIIAGFIIAMPVGPVAVMCIHRTLVQGALYGYVSGIGAAAGDTISFPTPPSMIAVSPFST